MASLTSAEVRAYVVAHLKERYRRGLLLVRRLENENRDARQRGESFASREALYGRRIRAGREVLAREAQEGIAASRAVFAPMATYQDVRDAHDLWEPFGLSTGDISPVKV